MQNGPVLKIRTSPFNESNDAADSARSRRRVVFKSLGWLWSFRWRLWSFRWSSSSWSSSGGAAAAGTRSSGGGAAWLWCAAAWLWCTAGLGWLAATDLSRTAAAASFSRTTNAQHNGDRSSSCKSEHTIHSRLPQNTRDSNAAADPRRAHPPAAALIPSRSA